MTLHVIYFMRSINPDTLAGLQHATLSALKEGATELVILISSDGGNTDQGFAAYHFLRSLSIPVTMHCIGNIESMAVVMFLAGTKRLIVPHGKVKVHPMNWSFTAGAVDHARLAECVASLDFDAKRYADIFEERTNGARKILRVRSHLEGKAKLLGAAASVEAGIATGVEDASIPATAPYWWV
ncbi:hypothetical protein HA050_18395 [Iodobacter sp. HSC-16F04]|uniref:ATP-dependent Clp protease proteolytic subunit n=1 Tax=Iodobacter violaceini TaxID=3044271 RepID=A0ABX0L084_9NEIS|nr:ATP-dependent Clp protease proteolytic subunit [Iodobacter violacea]NHQ88080.1 hypothetical protein [Iodobacter violacea]